MWWIEIRWLIKLKIKRTKIKKLNDTRIIIKTIKFCWIKYLRLN